MQLSYIMIKGQFHLKICEKFQFRSCSIHSKVPHSPYVDKVCSNMLNFNLCYSSQNPQLMLKFNHILLLFTIKHTSKDLAILFFFFGPFSGAVLKNCCWAIGCCIGIMIFIHLVCETSCIQIHPFFLRTACNTFKKRKCMGVKLRPVFSIYSIIPKDLLRLFAGRLKKAKRRFIFMRMFCHTAQQ